MAPRRHGHFGGLLLPCFLLEARQRADDLFVVFLLSRVVCLCRMTWTNKRLKEKGKFDGKDNGPYTLDGGVKCELLKCHVFPRADSLDMYSCSSI